MNSHSVNTEFDAIVVGSGPGGAAVARELSKRRKKVLILERGGNAPLKEGLLTTIPILDEVRVGEKLAMTRAMTTGGTTAVYFGVADLPPLEKFAALGIELSGELEEAKRELPLAVLPDHLLGAQSMRVRDTALNLGYAWQKKLMLVDQSKCTRGYTYEARWNARSFVREAVDAGATLVNRAKVLRVIVEDGRALGVEYEIRTGRNGRDIARAFGARTILAAGGAVSPLILRDSGLKSAGGNGFYCHPSVAVFGIVPGLKAGDTFLGNMGAVIDENMALSDASCGRTFFRMFMLGQRRFVRAFLHSKSIGVGAMVKEELGGTLRQDGFHKELAQGDLDKLRAGERMAREIVEKAGGKHLFTTPLGAAHLGGALPINKEVDQKLETEIRGLHVCDSSVIPANVKIAPTLTLVCLGKYLGKRLAQST